MADRIESGIKDQFKILDIDSLPRLIVGIDVTNRMDGSLLPYKFFPRWKILNIAHQGGGLACEQSYFHGKLMTVRAEYKQAFDKINLHWSGSGLNNNSVTLDRINTYREALRELIGDGADCSYSSQSLKEGIYPLDFSPTLIDIICTTKIPSNPDEMIDWDSMVGEGDKKDAQFYMSSNWGLWILGWNDD